jgi:hypothetical protein
MTRFSREMLSVSVSKLATMEDALQASGGLFGYLHPLHCKLKRMYHRDFVFLFVLSYLFPTCLSSSTSRQLPSVFLLKCNS